MSEVIAYEPDKSGFSRAGKVAMGQARRARRKSVARILRPREGLFRTSSLSKACPVRDPQKRWREWNGKAESRSLAPQPGLEPGTLRLTAECSTIELLRSKRTRTTSVEPAHEFITHGEKSRQPSDACAGWPQSEAHFEHGDSPAHRDRTSRRIVAFQRVLPSLSTKGHLPGRAK